MEDMESAEDFFEGPADGFFYHEGNEALEGTSGGPSRGWETFIPFRNFMVQKIQRIGTLRVLH